EQVVATDRTWKAAAGPILMSEIYHGETYDARRERPGWDAAGYDDADWHAVRILDAPKSVLVAQENVPVKRIEEIEPAGLFRTPAGDLVVDMGQNMVGWVRLRVSGPRGGRVVLRHGEVLDKDGNFYAANLRSARQTVEYILKGEGEECFEPHFTFQGFRYVKVEEFPGEPDASNFRGIVVHSAMERTGEFSCSHAEINQLQHNILWGLKGNFVDVPTDCPQRDERLGWTGDAQVFIRTACFLMNAAPFYAKWLKDLRADQREDGGVPHVIPDVLGEENHSSSGWADAAVICPWTVYLSYGDERILAEQYDSMKSWVEYVRAKAENGLIWRSGFHFGDWVALDAKEGSYFGATAVDLIATAYYAHSAGILAKAARVLGREEDVRSYRELRDRIAAAFRAEFFTPAGRLAVPTQTAHVLALVFGLAPEEYRRRTVDTLVRYLEENGWHLTTGFLGTPHLLHALSANGRLDAAYRLLQQTDYPSWLYQVARGATTIWEHWDGIKPDGSFWSPEMNSFNHYAYGAVGDWLYRVAAGIEVDEERPGYKHILIKPQPGGELSFARAELASMYGLIRSAWTKEGGRTRLRVTIPPNTTASVILSGAQPGLVTVDGKAATEVEGVLACAESAIGVSLELGSGEYEIVLG
ncbi:MAG: family 78 glycoside hydrolase catalytic domain, partial [Bacteroidota bacterium]